MENSKTDHQSGSWFWLASSQSVLARRIRRVASRITSIFVSRQLQVSQKMLSILNEKYGHWQTVVSGESINREGDPIPWYTYPAIEYLAQLDFSDKKVFEWGAGRSSFYWAHVAGSVTSVEDNLQWFEKVSGEKTENLLIHLIQDEMEYVNAIALEGCLYDVIVIDGSYRFGCANIASKYLEEGGLIILDNSDWQPLSAAILREASLLQVDMSGFGPIAQLTWTTSLFFHRDFNVSSKEGQQPRPSLGAVPPPNEPKYKLR